MRSGDLAQRVLRAGEHALFGPGHARQGLGVLHHRRHVHHAGDVDAAAADEGADARRLRRDVALGRELPLAGKGVAGRRQQRRDLGCRRGALHDALWNVHGLGGGTRGEDAWPAGLQRREFLDAGEAVLVELDAQRAGQVGSALGRLQTHGQHHHVKGLVVELAGLVLVAQDQVPRADLLAHHADAAAVVD